MTARRLAWLKLAVATALALGLLWFFALRGLGILSLDLRALLHNLSKDDYLDFHIRDAWITWGAAAIRLGPIPLAALFLGAVLLRLRARWALGSWTVGHLSFRARLGLAALVLAPYLAFCAPMALALTVWLMVEGYWWVQWYGNREPGQWLALYYLPPVLAAGAALAGAWATAYTLRRTPPPQRPRGWRRWARLAPAVLISTPVFLPCAVLGLGLVLHSSRLAGFTGAGTLLEDKCGGCHRATRPLYFVKTPNEWRYLVHRMREDHGAKMTAPQEEQVTGFLQGMRSFSDSWTFRTRCQRCHGAAIRSWDDRHPDDWKMIVARVARYSPHYYPRDVSQQVSDHLARTKGKQAGDPSEAAAIRTIKVCTSCHFFSRGAEHNRHLSDKDAEALVRRMSQLMDPPLSEQEIQSMAQIYRSLATDPQRMKHAVPHDEPVLQGGLPW